MTNDAPGLKVRVVVRALDRNQDIQTKPQDIAMRKNNTQRAMIRDCRPLLFRLVPRKWEMFSPGLYDL